MVIGPGHYVALRGIAIPTVGAFETPLGAVVIDRDALTQLTDLTFVQVDDAVHAPEHALEVELPFLQMALGQFRLVPLVVGEATPTQVAAALERLWGGTETLVVISSDMGRTPKVGDALSPTGRNHWNLCQTALLAGGGVRGGQVYGASDRIAAFPKDQPVQPVSKERRVRRERLVSEDLSDLWDPKGLKEK